MFDNVCKFLAATFPSDFATWLLGETVPLTELSPSELSLEPIRADALLLMQSQEVVLHLEFQTQPNVNIPFRMIDYCLRIYRRFPQKQLHQVVIYLRETNSALARQNQFTLPKTRHEFSIIRLWEEPTAAFLQSPGLLPFAVLTQTSNPLAQRILRRELMRESPVYQDMLQEGKAEGRAEAMREVAINLLKQGMPLEQIAIATGLPIATLQQLQQASNPPEETR